jgi:hypothetical protein
MNIEEIFCKYKNEDYVYVYQCHGVIGFGIDHRYTSSKELTKEDTWCEMCEDYDKEIDRGYVRDLKEKEYYKNLREVSYK